MQYEVKTVKKVGVGGYEDEINKIIKPMASDRSGMHLRRALSFLLSVQ